MPIPVEKIIEIAQKGGFDTELKVASILAGKRWQVDQSVYYIDKDQNEGRELDIYAYLLLGDSKVKPEVSCLLNFCIEVKKTKEPFIFFSSRAQQFERGSGYGMLHWRHNVDSNVLSYKEIEKRPFAKPQRIARSYMCAKDAGTQQIRGGLLSAVKSAVHYTEACNEQSAEHSRDICFFIPILVVDGPLSECYFDEMSGDLVAKEVETIVFLQNYLSPQYGRISNRVYVFTVDAFEKSLPKYHRWAGLIVDELGASRNVMVKGGVASSVPKAVAIGP